jgi:hypothetical protein
MLAATAASPTDPNTSGISVRLRPAASKAN